MIWALVISMIIVTILIGDTYAAIDRLNRRIDAATQAQDRISEALVTYLDQEDA